MKQINAVSRCQRGFPTIDGTSRQAEAVLGMKGDVCSAWLLTVKLSACYHNTFFVHPYSPGGRDK